MTVDWQHVPAAQQLDPTRMQTEYRQLGALSQRPRVSRRVVVVGATGFSALALTGAGVAYVAFAPVEDTSSIRCFSDTSLAGPAMYASMAQGQQTGAPAAPGAGTAPQIEDPVGLCADLWEQGLIVAGDHSPHSPRPDAHLPVPPLTACVVDDSDSGPVVGVVPGGREVCRQMGLARWEQ